MLSKKAKYALKALEYLAKSPVDSPVLIAVIAHEQKIPRKFLETILLELKNEGVLKSKMGKNGGYSLLVPANKINIGSIIRLIDGPVSFVSCVSEKYYKPCAECKTESTCGLKSMMAEVREATIKVLEKITLQEIVNREKLLSQKSETKNFKNM
jgi:Rrf2 family protein